MFWFLFKEYFFITKNVRCIEKEKEKYSGPLLTLGFKNWPDRQNHLKGHFHTVKLASKYKRNKYDRNSILGKTLMTLLHLRTLTLIHLSIRLLLLSH